MPQFRSLAIRFPHRNRLFRARDRRSNPSPSNEESANHRSASAESRSCGTDQFDPLQTSITTPAAGRVGCEADIHTGLVHVGAHLSRDGAELLWNMPVEPLI